MAFAWAWLFEEFSRASGAYRLFYPCGLLEKPYTINTGCFTPVGSPKSHLAPLQGILPLCAPQKAICPPYSGFFPCVLLTSHFSPVFPHRNSSLYWWYMAFWGAHRGKILWKHCLLVKAPQKATLPPSPNPPIWGALFLESHYGHNILQRKKALAIEALRVENVIMRTKLLKWSSFSPNFTQKVSFSPLPRTLLPHGIGT